MRLFYKNTSLFLKICLERYNYNLKAYISKSILLQKITENIKYLQVKGLLVPQTYSIYMKPMAKKGENQLD